MLFVHKKTNLIMHACANICKVFGSTRQTHPHSQNAIFEKNVTRLAELMSESGEWRLSCR
jgi:hypothetical protein